MVNKKSSPAKMIEDDAIPETDASRDFLNFFIDELKDIYWAEKHLTRSLPKMEKAATSPGLKNAMAKHLATTQLQVEKLELVFEMLGETARAKKSDAMAGLIEEATSVIRETIKGNPLRDAALVLAAQKIGHHEIATYTGLVQLARTMGNEDIITLLEETLAEEQQSNDFLNGMAETLMQNAAAPAPPNTPSAPAETVQEVYNSINLDRKTTNKD